MVRRDVYKIFTAAIANSLSEVEKIAIPAIVVELKNESERKRVTTNHLCTAMGATNIEGMLVNYGPKSHSVADRY